MLLDQSFACGSTKIIFQRADLGFPTGKIARAEAISLAVPVIRSGRETGRGGGRLRLYD
ncbi:MULTISPECIES: hypothetical protein [Actinomycetes]|uniref:hypothetical protein n=1 Tax=Actinomycetes TaxID=1760 RepID=UPI0001B579FD|nr:MULTISPECIES: hypothetical protein [Actinomycetes]